MKKLVFVGLCWVILLSCVQAQDHSPVYTYFSTNDLYPAGPQNWDFVRGEDGLLYVANSSAILQYDGKEWKPLPNSTSKGWFRMWESPSGLVYVGSHSDIGYLAVGDTSNHQIDFYSILEELGEEGMPSHRIEWIFPQGETICFGSKHEVLQWLPKARKFRRFAFEHEILFGYAEDRKGRLICKNGNTISTRSLEGEELYSTRLAGIENIGGMLSVNGNDHLLFTKSKGIRLLSNANHWGDSRRLLQRFPGLQIIDAIYLRDGKLALATSKYGVLVLDEKGNFHEQLYKGWGMPETGMISLFQDKENNLWVGMDRGIMRLNYPGSLRHYGSQQGLEGIVLSILEANQTYYLGTTEGLFLSEESEEKGVLRFTKLPSVASDVWDMISWEGQVFLATTSGTYQGSGNAFRLLDDTRSRAIYRSEKFPNTIFVGLEDGLAYMEHDGRRWVWRGRLEGVKHRVKSIVEDHEGSLWVGNTEISRIRFESRPDSVGELRLFDESDGITADMREIQLYSIYDTIRLANFDGLARYDERLDKIVPDSAYGLELADGKVYAYELAFDTKDQLWMTQGHQTGVMLKNEAGGYTFDWKFLAGIKTDIWSIYPDKQGNILIGGSDGLYIYDPSLQKGFDISFCAGIRKVNIELDTGNQTVFRGTFCDPSGVPVMASDTVRSFAYPLWEISFSFTGLYLKAPERMKYRYWLKGYNRDKKTKWIEKSEKSYTSLREGNYTFWVEAQNELGEISIPAYYKFRILPPWYRSWWAYGIYALIGLFIFGLVLFAIYRVQRKIIMRQQAALDQQLKLSQQLAMIDRVKDQFLQKTSAQIRTPLQGMVNLSETLKEEIHNSMGKENLSLIIASGRRLTSMINDLLDFTKIKNNELILSPRPVNLYSIADIVVNVNQPLIVEKPLAMVNLIDPDLDPVWADEQRLQQIIFNLVGNAIKFTERGHIKIGLVPKGDVHEVFVQDTGTGIPEDKRELIFKEFERENLENDSSNIVSALGLSISKKLIEMMGGEMWVESEVDQGSTFYFTLPVAKGVASPTAKLNLEEIEPNNVLEGDVPTKKRTDGAVKSVARLLVVDDELINQRVYQSFLKDQPYDIVKAMDGQEAIDILARDDDFDLVLLDILMPRMSGYEVCQKIRETYSPSQLPIILMTVQGQIHDLVQGFTVGANDYFTRPFTQQEFLSRLKTHLNLQKINEATNRFVPNAFLRSLGRENITDVRLGDHIEREVTIMFADIRNYTTVAEKLEPEENFKFVSRYATSIGPLINQNNGFVHQYLGDGVMAIFENKPEDALRAAIAMQKEVDKFYVRGENTPIEVGIGLHSGKLIMGVIGDQKRLQVSTISDAVNTASRMEGLTKYYGVRILFSEETLTRMENSDEFRFRYLGQVQVKGKHNAVGIYECIDGDHTELFTQKMASLSEFQHALQAFYHRDFVSASQILEQILRENPEDSAASYFFLRATHYMVEGVEENWTGVQLMDKK